MRYDDAYATHANIGCENKQLRCNILKKLFMLLKQHYGYLMLFFKLTIQLE